MKKILLLIITGIVYTVMPASAQLIKMQGNSSIAANTMSIVNEGIYFIRINETGKYFGIEGVNPNNGARLVQWDFVNQNNHKFQINKSPDGYYYIKALHSNRFLNVAGQSTQDGSPVLQWDFVEQDNLKWAFYFDAATRAYIIRNKQSGKELKLAGSNTNTGNGAVLTINGNAGRQTFILQPVNETRTAPATGNLNKIQQTSNVQEAAKSVSIRLSDGTSVMRYINPAGLQKMKPGDTKKEIASTQKDETCETKTARIEMDTKGFIPVTASTYLEYNAPGLIYDVRRFYSGDYTNRQEFPNGEKRNPIVIATTVRNTTGNITEPVVSPTKNNINQAIANLQKGYSVDRLQTTSQSMIYRSSYVQSNTEMQMKIGASGHYMIASFDADMKIANAKEKKTFFVEAEKELFALSTDQPQGGFFNADIPNIGELGYISRVSYGVKIIGKIEVDNTEESLGARFSAMVEAGFAGGRINFESLSRESNQKVNCFFYVVGGMSETVTGTNLNDVYNTVNNILANVNYKTCMPIRVDFRSVATGSPITYKDVTNNFVYDVCTPKAIQEANKNLAIKINSLTPIGSDIEMYGDVWAEVWSPTHGDLKRFRTTDNVLFTVKKEAHLEKDQMSRYAINLPAIKYEHVPPGFFDDAEIHIYYNVIDYNTVGADDHLQLRGGQTFVVRYMNLLGNNVPVEAYYRSVIRVKDLTLGMSNANFFDLVDGDGVTIGVMSQLGVEMQKK